MNRKEHLAWCKTRALEYVALDQLGDAISSMISDLGKHRETSDSVRLAQILGSSLIFSPSQEIIKFIEDFN